MAYHFDFLATFDYTDVLVKGILTTIELIAVGGVIGIAVGIFGAWARTQGPRWLKPIVSAYVEVIRNTPFLVQLFFIFFGLPGIGVQISELHAAILAMVINLGAYSTEIIRAGVAATARGQIEAGLSLSMTHLQVFRHIILRPALQKIVIVMLGSSVCSQIAVEELSFAANFIQSRNFRAFEAYFVSTLIYLAMAILLRQLLRYIGMIGFSLWDILRNLLLALRWTVALSLLSFLLGGTLGMALLFMGNARSRLLRKLIRVYIEVFQGTPLLMQLFLVFFGLALFGMEVPAWLAASLALTFWSASFLAEIWRGCVASIVSGQWEASACLAMSHFQQMRYIILPQALRIAIAPTVGFGVQIIKATAVTSIIGFIELSKA
eukprot:gene26071-28464_t